MLNNIYKKRVQTKSHCYNIYYYTIQVPSIQMGPGKMSIKSL